MNDPRPDEETRPSLLREAVGGDNRAWETLVRIYSPAIFGWCKRAGLRSEDAGDVVQETWTSVATALGKFDLGREGASFRGWLYTISRNKVRDRARRRVDEPDAEGGTQARRRIEELPADESEESRADPHTGESSDLRRALAEVRGEFEDRTYRMFWETAVAGRSAKEVAGEFAVSPAAVFQAKSRVSRRLRALLGAAR